MPLGKHLLMVTKILPSHQRNAVPLPPHVWTHLRLYIEFSPKFHSHSAVWRWKDWIFTCKINYTKVCFWLPLSNFRTLRLKWKQDLRRDVCIQRKVPVTEKKSIIFSIFKQFFICGNIFKLNTFLYWQNFFCYVLEDW